MELTVPSQMGLEDEECNCWGYFVARCDGGRKKNKFEYLADESNVPINPMGLPDNVSDIFF